MVAASLPQGTVRVKADEPEVVASGTCGATGDGSSVTWKLTKMETTNEITYYKLTISGNGEIKWHKMASGDIYPWYDYESTNTKIKEAVVEEGVTNIPDYTFKELQELEKVVFPESLLKIGSKVFESTFMILEVNIPSNVYEIAFNAFYGNYCINAVNVDSLNKYYSSKNGVLFDKTGTDLKFCPITTTSYEIPDGTKILSYYAFNNVVMTELIIPHSIVKIDPYAFNGCKVSKLIYRGTENQWNEAGKNLNTGYFYNKEFAQGYNVNMTGGTAVATAAPGSTVTVKADDIEGKAFEAWTSTGQDVIFDDATAEIATFVMPDHEVSISGSYIDATSYTITMVDGTANRTKAVAGKTVNIKANTPAEGKLFSKWSGDDVEFADVNVTTTTFTMPAKDVTITANYVEGYNVTVIDGSASPFLAAEGTTVTITPKDIEGKIFTKWTSNDVSFENANEATTTFTMPAKAVTITANYVDGYNVTVSDGNASPSLAAEGTTVNIKAIDIERMKFSHWTSEDGVTFADANADSTTFTMPAKAVTVKANYVEGPTYWYCGAEGDGSNVTWSINEAGDTIIISGTGPMADYYKSNGITRAPWGKKLGELKNIVIGSGITQIGNYAFYGNHFKTITIPGNVKKIGEYAFYGDSCESLTIEEGVEDIGYYPFGDLIGKPTIKVPDSVKSIEPFAFSGAGDVFLYGEGIEYEEFDPNYYPFAGINGTLYAPATSACKQIETGYNTGFDVVYICQVPTLEKDKFTYTGSEIVAFEPGLNPGYTVSGNKGTAIGDYTATFKLNDTRDLSDVNSEESTAKYVWGDLSKPNTWDKETDTADKTFAWSIIEPVVLSSIAVTTVPAKTTYTEGESFDATGMVVTAKYSNGTSKAVTGYTYSPNGKLTTSDNAVTVSYTENGVTKTATQAITVKAVTITAPVLESIAISTAPAKTAYTEGDSFIATGMVVTAKYSDGTSKAVTGYTYSPNGKLTTSDNTVTISYSEGGVTKTVAVAITVKAKTNTVINDNNNNNYNNGSGNGNTNNNGNIGTITDTNTNTNPDTNTDTNKDTNTEKEPDDKPDPKPVVTENPDGTSTVTEVKKDEDGSTVKTAITTDPDGKLVEKVTETTEKNPDGKVTVNTTTEKPDGTQTVNEVTTNSKGKVVETVNKEISIDEDKNVTEKSVTEKSNGTIIEGTKKTSPSGEVVTDTVETRKTGMVITTNIVEKKNGSTTTTKEVTKKDGNSSVTKTTQKKNGSSTVETFKTNSKGKITSYSNETVDKNGNKETITYSVKKQAKGKGKKATPGTVKIGKVSSEAEKVEIPEQITIDGKKYVVNAISARAYANDESITEVHIGSNIMAIGAGVFEGASNLKNIYIDADHLKRVGDNAFAGIPEDATITIKAKDKAFDKVVSMLKASGLSSNVTIVKAE